MALNHSSLRAFHAVASHGSFSRAAEALHVTQPTLSGQVRELERRFAVRLFERTGRGVVPTELGRALHDRTRRLFALENEAEQLLSAANRLVHGDLKVGADAPYHVIPLLAAFNRAYPGVALSLSFGNTEQLLRGLIEQRYDVAILPNVRGDTRLYAVPLKPDRLVAFVARGHPWSGRRSIRLRELDGQRLVLRERGSTTRAIFERAASKAGLALADVLEIGSREGVREAVAAGLGVGIVSESERGNDTRLHFLPVRDARLRNVEHVACLDNSRDKAAVRAFFDILRKTGAGAAP
jgi:aminoethylphosphonate catabolism LysR family transcriptional regulator